MKLSSIFVLLIGFFSCQQHSEKIESKSIANERDSIHVNSLNVTNERDPICDMSVREHVSDTALVDGKVWGFCSPVCKEKYVEAHNSK